MSFNPFEGLKKAGELKKENESIKKIKADIISASGTDEKKAVYKYFSGEDIIDSLSMTTDIAKKAKELIKKGQVKLESVEENTRKYDMDYGYYFEQDTGVYGRAKAHIGSDDCNVRIDFSKNELTDATCDCARCFNKNRMSMYYGNDRRNCEHVVATVFLLNAYLDSHELGDETNYFGDSFLSYYDNEASDEGSINVVPRLILSEGPNDTVGAFIQFRIGKKKLLMIKNYVSFVNAIKGNEIYPLGKKDSVRLSYSVFDEESLKYVKFIETLIEKETAISYNLLDYARTRFNVSRIQLDPSNVDDIFDLLVGKRIELVKEPLTKKNITTEIEFREHSQKIRINITPIYNDGQFGGINLRLKFPLFIQTGRNVYCISDEYFDKCDNKILDLVKALRIQDLGYHDVKIGRKNIGRFYSKVLPIIRDSAIIKDEAPEAIEFIPEEADITFYLDMEGNNAIGKIEANYSGGKVDVLSGKVLERTEGELLRDLKQESKAVDVLKKFMPDNSNGDYLSTNTEDELYELKVSGIDVLNRYGKVLGSDGFNNVRVYKRPSTSIGVSVKSNLLQLELLSDDMSPEELVDIVSSYRKKKKYYRLKNGAFVNMDSEYMENFDEMLNVLNISSKDLRAGALSVPLYRSIYIDEMMKEHNELIEKRDKSFAKLIGKFDSIKSIDFIPPDEVVNVLRGYQKEGFKWLRSVEELGFGGILADDMGLGKTLQVISLLIDAKQNGRLTKALIVCPASLVYNWSEEISKFDNENILKVSVLAAAKEERQKSLEENEDVDIYISSYDTLRRDISLYHDMRFSHQIIDEAQFIKNQNTGVAKTVKAVQADVKFALTGTPIENRLSELWSIFDYIMPGFLYSYTAFRTRYENDIVKTGNEDSAKLLSKMIAPFVLRRLKSEVALDLPDKIEEVRVSRFDRKQQLAYDGELSNLKKILLGDKDYNNKKMIVLAEITKLRQICCDPNLIFDDYSGESAKLDTCIDLVKSGIEAGHKILLFSQFSSMLDIISKRFEKEKITSFMITGSTPKDKRLTLVNKFNHDDTNVFLISLKAGGTGLNLTGADIVIHYDPWWNFAAQNQATDRAHRIGQKNTVTVYRLIAKGTIEERIVKLQESKKDLADRVLNFEEGMSLSNISREELLELLG